MCRVSSVLSRCSTEVVLFHCSTEVENGFVLGLNPWLCTSFKLVWVKNILDLGLVGLKTILNGYGSSLV